MNKLSLTILLIFFAISRIYIFLNPPLYYSDVTADYERYANIWRYGMTPYLEHLYEYPPASIPLLSLPLTLDQAGWGKYYPNYRLQILVIDSLFFVFLLHYLYKQKSHQSFVGLLAYIALTTVAKDFLYEGLDLAFSASYVVGIVLLSKKKRPSLLQKFVAWAFFWLSTAIKFLTFPLLVPLFFATVWKKNFLSKKSFMQTTVIAASAFLLIWGAPLIIYRSSLSVSFVHNFARPIKYASFPAHIIRWVNTFTQTESQNMVAPDFEYVGPVSQQVTQVVAILFPLVIFGFLIWSILRYRKQKTFTQKSRRSYLVATFGTYIFLLFITAKTFSQPFHIWYLVLLPLIKYKNIKQFLVLLSLMLLLLLLDTTSMLAVHSDLKLFAVIPLDLLRDSLRFLPMFGFVWYFYRYHEEPSQ